MRLSTVINSVIVVALILIATMLSVLGGSLAFNNVKKVETESVVGLETGSQTTSESVIVESETTKLQSDNVESDTIVTDKGCSICEDIQQSTQPSSISNQEPVELNGELTSQPPGDDPCYPCFVAVPKGLQDAKEELKDTFPKFSDYDKSELGWGLLYINDVISWFTSIGPVIKTKISDYGYDIGENLAIVLGNTTAIVIEILQAAWQFYIDGKITFFVLTMIFSPLYIIPIAFGTLVTDFIELCFAGSGENNEETQIIEQVTTETMIEQSYQQQNQNI